MSDLTERINGHLKEARDFAQSAADIWEVDSNTSSETAAEAAQISQAFSRLAELELRLYTIFAVEERLS